MSNQFESRTDGRGNRRYAVSANRTSASHRIRYIETGGAAVNVEECTFCQSVPALDTRGDENAGAARGETDDTDRPEKA